MKNCKVSIDIEVLSKVIRNVIYRLVKVGQLAYSLSVLLIAFNKLWGKSELVFLK
ncbi:hypothetical protein [Shewanella sp. HL-SH2]|uniref:hypothetical protein n=1 Tax=Shewanella sp. HL-SH2 TaxID=3436238 RepID=UPI003EBB064B